MNTAINLWSVRNFDEPFPEIVERVADAGYDGVQFSGGLRGASVEDLVATLDAVDLETVPAHVGVDALETALDATVETYAALGCDSLVVPYLDAENFADRAAVDATAERLDGLADRLGERGLGLHYHNHDAEFRPVGDGVAFDRLVEATTGVDFEVDVGWVLAAGHDPVARLRQVDGRCSLVHMRDVTADGEDAELGDGAVDLAACAAAARDAGAGWLVYERVDPEDHAASIEHGARFLGDL